MSEVVDKTHLGSAPSQSSVLNSAWWMSVSNVVAQGFAYGSLLLLARWLSPASFGTVSVGAAFVTLGSLFVDRGTWGTIVVQRNLTRIDLKRAFRRCLLVATLVAAAMAAAANVVVDRFASDGDAKAIAVLALCLPLHAVAVVPTALLQKTLRFRQLSVITVVSNVMSAALAVIVALGGFGIWALVARQVVLFAMLALLSSVLCRRAFRTHKWTLDPQASGGQSESGGRWFFLFALAYVFQANIAYFVIGGWSDAAVVGLYSVASTIALAPTMQISSQVGKVLFAATASEPDTCAERTEQSVLLMSTLMLPLLPLGILVAPTILPAAFGPEWKPMVTAFQILLVVGVFQAVIDCVVEPISGTGHMSFRAKVMIAQCVSALVALGILVPMAGIRGAALAQILVFVPAAAVLFTAGTRRAGTSPGAVLGKLRPVAVALGLQLVVTAVVLTGLMVAGAPGSVSTCVAAIVGLASCIPLLLRTVAGIRQ